MPLRMPARMPLAPFTRSRVGAALTALVLGACALILDGSATGSVHVARAASAEPTREAPPPARPAAPPWLPLELTAPEGCVDDADFTELVRLRAPDSHAPAGWHFVVELSATTSGAEGRLRVFDARGEQRERKVVGRDCRDAAEALSLITALLLESDEPAPPPPAPAPPPASPVPSVPAEPVGRASWRLFAGLSVLTGSAPRPMAAGLAGLEWQYEDGSAWAPRVRLAGIWTEERAFTVATGAVSFQQVGAVLDLCPVDLVPGPVSVHPCASGEAAALHASGWGAEQVEAHSVPFGAAGLGLLAGVGLGGGFRVELRGAALAPFWHDRFLFAGGVVHTIPDVVFRAGAELSLDLGF